MTFAIDPGSFVFSHPPARTVKDMDRGQAAVYSSVQTNKKLIIKTKQRQY